MERPDRCPVGDDTERLAALAHRVPALDCGRCVRRYGTRLASLATTGQKQERTVFSSLFDGRSVQNVTHNPVKVAFVDQNYTGDNPKDDAKEACIEMNFVKLPEAKKGFVLLPRRWVGERSFAWTARFRRLARDFERTPETFRNLHFLAFAILMLHTFVKSMAHIL